MQAYPQKLFPIACMLLRCNGIQIYDTGRYSQVVSAPLHQGLVRSFVGDSYDKEYEKQINDSRRDFRQKRLETLALEYQMGKHADNPTSADHQRNLIEQILDEHYAKLPEKIDETDNQQMEWRLCLARMDYRKMHPELAYQKDGENYYSLVPEVDPKVHAVAQQAEQVQKEFVEASNPWAWAKACFYRSGSVSESEMSAKDPKLIIQDVKNIITLFQNDHEDGLNMFRKDTPAYISAVLLRDRWEEMEATDRDYCVDIIMQYSSMLSEMDYSVQRGDCSAPTIASLPIIIKMIPSNRKDALVYLLQFVLHPRPELTEHALFVIQDYLWFYSQEDAWSILLGYLYLSPKYAEYRKVVRKSLQDQGIYQSPPTITSDFMELHRKDVDAIMSHRLSVSAIDFALLELTDISFALQMLPSAPLDKDVLEVFTRLSAEAYSLLHPLIHSDRPAHSHDFFEQFARLLLMHDEQSFDQVKKLLLEWVVCDENTESLLQQLIYQTDTLVAHGKISPDSFWRLWEAIFPSILDISKSDNYYRDRIIKTYLFATVGDENSKRWHSLRECDLCHVDKAVNALSDSPVVLFSISRLLYTIGYPFKEQGLDWLSKMIDKQPEMAEYPVNTVYYIEHFMRRYTLTCRGQIKRDADTRQKVLSVLNWLFAQGSSIGYLMREQL